MLDRILEALSPHLLSHGVTAVRIDGSSTLQQRRDALDKFNSNGSCVVMLATIGAVGEGYVSSIYDCFLSRRQSSPFRYSSRGEYPNGWFLCLLFAESTYPLLLRFTSSSRIGIQWQKHRPWIEYTALASREKSKS